MTSTTDENNNFADIGTQTRDQPRREGVGSEESRGIAGSGTGGFDEYGNQRRRSSFGGERSAGADTASRGMGTGVSGEDTRASGRGLSTGARVDDDREDDFEETGQKGHGIGQKLKSGAEKLASKVTGSSDMQSRSQERKTGGQY